MAMAVSRALMWLPDDLGFLVPVVSIFRRPRPLSTRVELEQSTRVIASNRFCDHARRDRQAALRFEGKSSRPRNGTQVSIAPGKAPNASAVDLDPHTDAGRNHDLVVAVLDRLDGQILG
jgi:hypothetical protein